jgi:hypothetical protein
MTSLKFIFFSPKEKLSFYHFKGIKTRLWFASKKINIFLWDVEHEEKG